MTTTTIDRLTPEQLAYIHRSPLPTAVLAADLGLTVAEVLMVTAEQARRHAARYGSAPCLDDDEPEDTLEADLAASLAALPAPRKTDADYREEARANHARLRALYPEA